MTLNFACHVVFHNKLYFEETHAHTNTHMCMHAVHASHTCTYSAHTHINLQYESKKVTQCNIITTTIWYFVKKLMLI